MIAIFAEMGFGLAEGPDIEDDFHNFTALNFPPKHPAREMHDTFWLPEDETGERKLLRTHTSPVQIRTMQRPTTSCRPGSPPARSRRSASSCRPHLPLDSDATHTRCSTRWRAWSSTGRIHMGHLKWTPGDLHRALLRDADGWRPASARTTSRSPSPRPRWTCAATAPAATLKIGQGDDWLEILGCGMVHPNVLRNCGLDPDVWQGFAFGFGIDRLGMLKYGMPDLRDMFASDVRWLEHYGFSAFARPIPPPA